MKRIGQYAAAAVVLVAASLVGCESDDPQPRISPSATSSSPVTPSPTSTSAAPEAESPEAFIQRWNAASTEMQNTGDPSDFAPLNSPKCGPCAKLVDLVEKYYAAGGYVKAQPWDIRRVTERPGGTATETVFEVEYVAIPTEFKPSADAPLEQTEGGRNTMALTLRARSGSWVVLNYLVAA